MSRRTILEMSPDVAVLQEVRTGSAQEFCDEDLQGKYKPITIRGNDSRGIDIVVIVKTGLPLDFVYESHKNEPMCNPLHPDIGKVFTQDLTALVARVPGPAGNGKPLFVLMGGHGKSKRDSKTDSGIHFHPRGAVPEECRVREILSQQVSGRSGHDGGGLQCGGGYGAGIRELAPGRDEGLF